MKTASILQTDRPRLVIHAGLHKTGTTSFQASCSQCRQSLLNAGVLYPAMPAGGHFDACHTDLAHWTARGDWDNVMPYLDDILSQAREDGAQTVLLSSEEFSSLGASPALLAELRERVEQRFSTVKILVVVRHLRALIRSILGQFLTQGAFGIRTTDIGAIPRHLCKTLAGFENVFERSMYFVSLEELRGSGTLCNALLRAAIPSYAGQPIPESVRNTTEQRFQPHYVFSAYYRGALATTLKQNPYSAEVEEQIEKWMDPERAARVFRSPSAQQEANQVLLEAIQQLADQALDMTAVRLREDFGNRAWFPMLFPS